MAILTGGSALANQVGGKIDLTPSKQNTLTDVSRHVLRGVHDPIRLTAFVEPLSKEASQLKQLAKQYRQAGARITLEVVDPDVQPARTRQAGVTLYGQVLVAIGDRHELLESADQIALTSAVHRLSAAASPQACFTVGHGERDITDQTRNGASALAGALRSLYFDVKPVALGALGAADELRACAVVVVAGPRVPMLPVEVDRLTEYARADGRLLVMGDGVALQRDSALREQLNGLLSPWGLSFGSGIISDLSALADDPSSIVSTDFPSASPPVLRLREQALPVVLVNAVAVERSEGSDDINVSPLVRSSPKSWVAAPPGQHLKGPFLVAADSDRSRLVGADEEHPSVARTRIGAVGSVDVMSNRVLEILGNRDFVVSLVQWIARSDDLVHALRPPSGFYKLVLTEAQKHRLVREGIVLPAVAVLLPLPLSVRRIRRG